MACSCEGTEGTEKAAGISDSYYVAPAASDSLGRLRRMALRVGFIGHLYLANF